MATERPPLDEMTLRQLRRVASECGVSRYSRMRKDQLLAAIEAIQRNRLSATQTRKPEAQEEVEAAKFDVGQSDLTGGVLAAVDADLAELPEGYGESRVVIMPRDPQWAYTYWDVPNEHKEDLR
ncbi:MAG: Rho termination factor N-terminal domain-containing protein, partial [Phormidesmis sp. CAN_BIN44]|nr:Rho termination factor N-terminal domain-containing protein [Phormidesmis sp. CAN_BIN44]